MTFSVSEISRLLLGPLGVILVDFGGLLGACWGQFGRPLVPLGILWSAVETLGSLCDPFGPLMVSFWNPCAPCGLLLDTSRSVFRVLLVILGSFLVHFRPKLCVLCVLCRYWQDFFAICWCVEFILLLQANRRFPSLAVQVFGSIWGPIGSPFGHILVHFGVLIFRPISEQKLIAFLGGDGGRGGLPLPAKLAGFARTCKSLV